MPLDSQQPDVAPDDTFDRLVLAESQGVHTNPDGSLLRSPKGALGVTQIMPATGANPGYGIEPLKDQSEGEYRRVGKQYLDAMMREFGGDERKAAAAYNAGPGAVKKAVAKGGEAWDQFIPDETKSYIKKVVGVPSAEAGPYSGDDSGNASPAPAKARKGTAAQPEPDWKSWPAAPLGEPAPAKEASFTGDVARHMAAEAARVPGVIGQGMSFVGHHAGLPIVEDAGEWLKDLSNSSAESWDQSMSPESRQALDNPLITEDWKLGPTPIKTAILNLTGMVPMVAATGGAGGAALKGLEAVGAVARFTRFAEAAGWPAAAAEKVAGNIARGTAFGGSGGVYFGLQDAASAEKNIMGMSWEDLNKDPAYLRAYAATDESLAPERRGELAKKAVAQAAGDYVFPRSTAMNGGLMAATGGGLFGALARPAGGVARRVAQGAAVEGATGTGQMVGSTVLQNKATQEFGDPTRELSQGVPNAVGMGMTMAGLGAAHGLRGPHDANAGKPVEYPAREASIHSEEQGQERVSEPLASGEEPPPEPKIATAVISGDIVTKAGVPFARPAQAMLAARAKGLEATHEPVMIGDNEWVLREKEGAPAVAEPATAAPTEKPAAEVPPAVAEAPAPAPAEPVASTTPPARTEPTGNDADVAKWAADLKAREDAAVAAHVPPPKPEGMLATDVGRAADNLPYLNREAAKKKLVDRGLADSHGVARIAKDSYVLRPKVVQEPAASTDSGHAQAVEAPKEAIGQAPTVDAGAHEVATSPLNDKTASKEQILGGSAELGHTNIGGLDVSIENPAGSIRKDLKNEPPKWQNEMKSHYGYIKGTVGKDKDHVDVFVRPGTPTDYAGKVFVVDQKNAKGGFDEHKAIIGFDSAAEAKAGYKENYSPGWDGIKSFGTTDMAGFKAWLKDGDTTKPFAPQQPRFQAERPDRSAAQTANDQRLSAKARGARQVNPAKDTLIPAIAKLGGLTNEHRSDITSEKDGHNPRVPFVGTLFSKGERAKGLDDMATALHEYGYLSHHDMQDVDGGVSKLIDKIQAELAGNPQYSEHNTEAADRHARDMQEQFHAGRLEQAGYNELAPETARAVDAVAVEDWADIGGKEMSHDDIKAWLDEGTEDAGSTAASGTGEGEGRAAEPPVNPNGRAEAPPADERGPDHEQRSAGPEPVAKPDDGSFHGMRLVREGWNWKVVGADGQTLRSGFATKSVVEQAMRARPDQQGISGAAPRRTSEEQQAAITAAKAPEQTPSKEGVSTSDGPELLALDKSKPQLDLTGQTETEARAEAKAADAAKAKEAADIKAADEKKAADAQREGFDLTGSDRAADANRTQDSLFALDKKPTDTPEFKRFFEGSKVVDEEGNPRIVYHGAKRPDRIGTEFKKSRATSGPMAFFTDDREIAGNYAKNKADTSKMLEDSNYEDWFKFKTKGERTPVNIERAWYRLSHEERQKIAELAPRVGQDEEGQQVLTLHPEGHKTGLGGYDQHIKEARGNHLKALVEEWLNSGSLHGSEEEFLDVLKHAGVPMDRVEMDHPHAEYPAVLPVYLSIKNPLETNAIPDATIRALEKTANRQRGPNLLRSTGDVWDKNSRDPREWVSELKNDLTDRKNSYVWTSIPDWVTKTLKGLGYDGIRDTGGKGSDQTHSVWIPFEPTQVKSAVGNRGTFDSNKRNMLHALDRGPSPEYEAAHEKANAAERAFNEVTAKYRAREIGDDEYLAARKERDAAAAEFDKAYEAESKRKPEPAPKQPNPQTGFDFDKIARAARAFLPDNADEPTRVAVTARVAKIAQLMDRGDVAAARIEIAKLLGDKRTQNYKREVDGIVNERVRGVDWVRERLIRGKRTGEIDPHQASLALWLLSKNRNLATDLALTIKQKGKEGTAGQYSPAAQLVTLIEGKGDGLTAAHEILHHAERMMPEKVQDGIREAWAKDLTDFQKWGADIPSEVAARAVHDVLMMNAGDREAQKRVIGMIHSGELPHDFYPLTNPSEYWAEHGSRILNDRAMAEQSWVGSAKQWLREFIQHVKRIFGLQSDHAVISGLESILSGTGERQTSRMMFDDPTNRGLAAARDRVFPALDRAEAIPGTGISHRTLTDKLVREFQDRTRSDKTFNWWHKSVGTQFHKAEVDKDFGKVFNKARAFETDTSQFAMDAADHAPSLLPRLSNMADVFKRGPKEADLKAVSQALHEGTLNNERLTRETARDRGMNDKQWGLYQEARGAIDSSLDDLAASEGARMLRNFGVSKDVVEKAKAEPENAKQHYLDALEPAYAQAKESLEKVQAYRDKTLADEDAQAQKDLAAAESPVDRAKVSRELTLRRDGLKGDLDAQVTDAEAHFDKIATLKGDILQTFGHFAKMKKEGYAPLMRYGNHTVYMHGDEETGREPFFSMHESQADANKTARALHEEFPDAAIKQGIRSEEAFKLTAGMSPDTLELFAKSLGADKSEVFQHYLRQSISDRSVLKRLIHRLGIAGYGTEVPRNLANFVTSNARAAARNYHFADMLEAAAEIPKHKGDVKDEAVKLVDYMRNPKPEANNIRALLFMNYLGGSVASAITNMTQPVMQTAPYLAKYVGGGKAAAALTKWAKVGAGGLIHDDALRAAMAKADKEGITAPHEIHQLYAESIQGMTNSVGWRKFSKVWGSFFSLAEQFNRRITFAAAWDIASSMKPEELAKTGFATPFAFAHKAVEETQGVYSKANRPDWARGGVGATLFTFKQFSIQYLEFVKRLPPQQQMLALGTLVAASGLQGLPFAQDIEDLIDTVGQAIGYNTNSKEWLRKSAIKALTAVGGEGFGKTGGDILLRGVSAIPGSPFDMSGRLGMGNLIPGTAMLKHSEKDKMKDVLEFAGPIGSLAKTAVDMQDRVQAGDYKHALQGAAPVAVQNALKGLEMLQTGQYKDQKGKKVIDVDKVDAMFKGLGLQPYDVAKSNVNVEGVRQDIAMTKQVQSDITDRWAAAAAERDPAGVKAAIQAMKDWNERNPESKISINAGAINSRAREMKTERDVRIGKSAPKAMRGEVLRDLRE